MEKHLDTSLNLDLSSVCFTGLLNYENAQVLVGKRDREMVLNMHFRPKAFPT